MYGVLRVVKEGRERVTWFCDLVADWLFPICLQNSYLGGSGMYTASSYDGGGATLGFTIVSDITSSESRDCLSESIKFLANWPRFTLFPNTIQQQMRERTKKQIRTTIRLPKWSGIVIMMTVMCRL